MEAKRIRILIDEEIPFVKGVFEPYADVVYLSSKEIDSAAVKDADALIVRSRTTCNPSLLEGSKVKFIATDTIITTHIDFDYCNRKGIVVRNASGCNAGGVMNYVFSALYGVASRKAIKLDGYTIGVIGAGNVGSRVIMTGRKLGFNVLVNDPVKMKEEGPDGYCKLDYLLENSDVVTMHVQLDETTAGMAGEKFFDKMKYGSIFINSSNGALVDEDALKKAIPKLGAVIIDTWAHEPYIDMELLDMVDLATPHIAGYSYQGKQNGTSTCVRTLARFFGLSDLYEFFPVADIKELEAIKLDLKGKTQGEITSVLQYNYPVFTDDFMFRMAPDSFEYMRSCYKYRREFYVD